MQSVIAMGILARLRAHDSSPAKRSPGLKGHLRGLTSESSSNSDYLACLTNPSQESKGTSVLGSEQVLNKPSPAAIKLPESSEGAMPSLKVDATAVPLYPMPGQFTSPAKHVRTPDGSDSLPPLLLSSTTLSISRPYSLYGTVKIRNYQTLQRSPGRPDMLSETSFSETEDSGSDANSSAEFDEDLEYSAVQKHPYYEQWKQYYQAMALYKASMAQNQGSNIKSSMHPGSPYSLNTPSSASTRITSMRASVVSNSSSQPDVSATDNLLALNSLKSTSKSNRSEDVPLLHQGEAFEKQRNRCVSADLSAPVPEAVRTSSADDLCSLRNEKPTQISPLAPESLVIYGLHELSLEPVEIRQISDYAAFLGMDTPLTPSVKESNTPECFDLSEPSAHGPLCNGVESLPPDKDVALECKPPKIEELNRQESSASTSSYKSLQSENNFIIRKSSLRLSPTTSRDLSHPEKSNKGPTCVPMPGPPPAFVTGNNRNVPEPVLMYNAPSNLHGHRMVKMNGANSSMIMPQRAPQFHSQMQQMAPYQTYAPQASVPMVSPYSSDPVINKRIDEFIYLRGVIASGNKTLEYRLKWMKTLLTATNYNLYSYINVKGTAVAPDQVMANKQLFIKAFVSHLQKLLLELDANKDPRKDKTFDEVCYIQGCLYMHDYQKYEQDFGYERDDEEAERFLKYAMELNPSLFQAYYKLGELYESQQNDDKFDMALEQYKESAKMGYNKAIFRIALIYLYVPKVRLVNFIKYFKELASIDMESADIKLEGPDRDELEEIVGLALFQLGKTYEGLYPGDLTEEDEFIQEAISIARVDYGKSLSYYNRAAKLHCLEAQVRLGRLYEFGELNRKPNASKSIQWYIKATTSALKFKRHPEAMLGVSRWFLKGSNGTSKHIPYPDPEGAIMWCERACMEFRYPEAYYQMGLLVEGDFADGDPYKWFAEAAELGHQEAQKRIEARMNPI